VFFINKVLLQVLSKKSEEILMISACVAENLQLAHFLGRYYLPYLFIGTKKIK
jgi:hypothetical protein